MSVDATLWALIEQRATLTPELFALVDEQDGAMTFAELHDRAEHVAAGLADLGIDSTARVSWQLPTWIESFVLVAALSRLGALQNPMLPIYREREIRYILREVRPQLLITPGVWRGFDHAGLAAKVVDDLRESDDLVCTTLVCDHELPTGDPATLPPPPDDPDATRWVFYTSGTTADPKGARHSDATITAGAEGIVRGFAFDEADRYPVVFPFTHIGGVGMLIVQLLSGAGAIVVERFDPEVTPPLLGERGLTIAAGGTPLALLYLQYQREHPERWVFPKVRATMTGAAPKPPGLHAELRNELGGIGAVSVYGLTEAPFLVCSSVRDPDEKLATTEGRAVPGVELRVVDEDGRECRPGETGEIRARGDVLFLGYLNPRQDASAFDDDGWFRTGDLGALDADGYVTVSGRLKDVIIRRGENISATEVEGVLYDHPKVADVVVVGVPDAELGERAVAVAIARRADDPPALDELARWCERAGLAKQKWPERLEVVDDFPRNASGKPLKHELRSMLVGSDS